MRKYFNIGIRQAQAVILISLITLLLLVPAVFSQEASPNSTPNSSPPSAKKLGITFPIADLGNCNSLSECKTFCSDIANKDACINFAKKKGFHRERKPEENRNRENKLVELAKSELGCNSKDECMAVCQKEDNFEKCANFAKVHGLGGGPKQKDRKILDKAKETLGCDSESSCKEVCQNPDNQEKCSSFARTAGLEGGVKRVGPGGCNSEESCKAYCIEHQDECMKFRGGPNERSAQNVKGPGGCEGSEACKKYCEEHLDECKNFGAVMKDVRREDFCKKNPEKCVENKGQGSLNKGPGNTEKFCRENPQKCKELKESLRRSDFSTSPQNFINPTDRPEELEGIEQEHREDEGRESTENREESSQNSGSGGGSSSGTSEQEVRGISIENNFIQKIVNFFKTFKVVW